MATRLVNVIAADATAGYFKAEVRLYGRPHLFFLASHTAHLKKKSALMMNSQDISTKYWLWAHRVCIDAQYMHT